MKRANNVVNGRSDSAQELVMVERPERATGVRLRIVKDSVATGRRVVYDKVVKTFCVFASYTRPNYVNVNVIPSKPDGSCARSFKTCVSTVIILPNLTELTIYHE